MPIPCHSPPMSRRAQSLNNRTSKGGSSGGRASCQRPFSISTWAFGKYSNPAVESGGSGLAVAVVVDGVRLPWRFVAAEAGLLDG